MRDVPQRPSLGAWRAEAEVIDHAHPLKVIPQTSNSDFHARPNDVLVGGLEHEVYFSIQLGMSSSLTFTPSFFRGVGQPPTSTWRHLTTKVGRCSPWMPGPPHRLQYGFIILYHCFGRVLSPICLLGSALPVISRYDIIIIYIYIYIVRYIYIYNYIHVYCDNIYIYILIMNCHIITI